MYGGTGSPFTDSGRSFQQGTVEDDRLQYELLSIGGRKGADYTLEHGFPCIYIRSEPERRKFRGRYNTQGGVGRFLRQNYWQSLYLETHLPI